MNAEDITKIATAFAQTLVNTMTKSTWSALRGRIAKVWQDFGSPAEGESIPSILDRDREKVAAGDPAGRAEVQQAWVARLALMLTDEAAADELRKAFDTIAPDNSESTSTQQQQVSGRGNIVAQANNGSMITIKRAAASGAILIFVAILVTYLVLRRDNSDPPRSVTPQASVAAAGPVAAPDSCGPPASGRADPPASGYVYKVTTGPGSAVHSIQKQGSVSQAFVAGTKFLTQVSAIAAVGNNASHRLRFELLRADNRVIWSGEGVENAGNNNADTVVNFAPQPVEAGSVLILRVVNISGEAIGLYLDGPDGQLMPAPYTACIDGETDVSGPHRDRAAQILAGSVTGTDQA